MIPLLLLVSVGLAIDREAVMDNAALFATHQWTMGSANQYASCSDDYVSDYTPGVTYRGIPYDWGGWVTCDEYDDYLAQSYGAGSHSWDGVLWCTVGVDCSGFVSQAWETAQKYSTSIFYQVTSDISVSSLKRGDALNHAGSHIVLFAYESDAGLPIHYEANGNLVFVDVDQGWSAFSDYSAVRYDDISDGATTGTISNPILIQSFPYEDLRWTAGAASDRVDTYSCSPSTDESGPEQWYHFAVETGGTLSLLVSDDDGVDIDIHVLSGTSGDDCLARDDTALSLWLDPGDYWITADTWVGSYEYAGPYLLTATFTGTLGDASVDPGDTGAAGAGDSGGAGDTGWPDLGGQGAGAVPPPGQRELYDETGGCGCGHARGGGGVILWLVALVGLAWRRRRHKSVRQHQALQVSTSS